MENNIFEMSIIKIDLKILHKCEEIAAGFLYILKSDSKILHIYKLPGIA